MLTDGGRPGPEDTHGPASGSDSGPAPLPPMPARVGRFRICQPLGAGGMSVVYEAYDDRVQRSVALKLLRGGRGQRSQARLQREAQALALLSHPNVVEVYEAGTHEGRAFLVMERLPGQPLHRWLKERPREVPAVVACFVQAGRGLAAAHAQGLVHRDFKPSNVLVDADGRVRVFDFGLAASGGDLSESTGDALGHGPLSQRYGVEVGASPEEIWETALTRTGAMLGTPAYMSPEQFEGKVATPASDQFAFCVALWEALYGEHPFVERERWEHLARYVLEGRVREPPAGRSVPAALERVLRRGLAVRPSARWPGMDALLSAVERAVVQRRRRWAWGLWGAGVVAAGAVAVLWPRDDAERLQPCHGAAQKLDELWGPARKTEIRGAMLDTGLPYADDTWQRVETGLDAYAAVWSDEHRDACLATDRGTQSEETLDGRMACLERRRHELGSLVGVLAVADRDTVRQAIAAVSQLDAIESCHQPTRADRAFAPPSDPHTAHAIATQREVLGRARALERAGKYREGLVLVRPVAAEADALGHAPLRAEAQLQQGRLLRYLGSHDEAEAALEQAYFLAEQVEHDEVALDAALMLAMVVGRLQQRPEAGLDWVEHARAVTERVGGPRARARFLDTEGVALWDMRRFDDALARFQEALPLFEQQWGPAHPGVAGVLDNTGLLLLEMHRPHSALDYIRRSLTIRQTALGPRHPEVGKMLDNQGLALASLERDDEALDSFRRAHALRREVLGPDHPDVAKPLANIAGILVERGEYDRAAQHAADALHIRERAHGEDSAEAAAMQGLLGTIRLAQGRAELAREHLAAATLGFEQALGAEHASLVEPLAELAAAERATGRLADAQSHAERALSLGRAHALEGEVMAALHLELARVQWERGDRVGAWDQAELSNEALAGLPGAAREREPAVEVVQQLRAWQLEHPRP